MAEKPHEVPKDDDTTSVHMTPNLHLGAVSMDCFGWVCDKCGHGQMTSFHTGDTCPGCGRKIMARAKKLAGVRGDERDRR